MRWTRALLLSPAAVYGDDTGGGGGARRECDYTKCAKHYRHETCKQLFEYEKCMAKFDKVCRGEMLYHSNLKGVKLKLDTMKCEQKKKRKSRLKNRASRRKNASKQQNYDASNSAGFQADQPTPQCRWEMSTSTTSTATNEPRRPLCAILGSGDMFRVKNFDGVPYTQCPLADGAVPIIELPYLLVMGSIADQKLTKVTTIVRDSGACAEFKSWHGEVDDLSPYFSDGTSHTGFNNTVHLRSLGQNAIQLTLQHINTKITIRQVIGGDWLQLTAVVPDELLSSDNEALCNSACPTVRHSPISGDRCDSFWCRNLRSTWGELAVVDAHQLDPRSWNVFNEKIVAAESGAVSFMLNCVLLLIYLIVL